MAANLRRVFPDPTGPVTVGDAYDLDRPVLPTRPWVGVCMIASLDGSVTVAGLSAGLGNSNDSAILLALREIADVIVVGAGTVRSEGYGPPGTPGRRVGVATNSGSVDLSTDLFRSGAGFVMAPESAEIDEGAVDVLRAGGTELDLGAALARIGDIVPGAEHVQVEGGPSLNGSMLSAGLIDEVNLTWSPRMVGGRGSRLTTGASELDERFELAHLLVDDDAFVFSRWTRRPAC